ncbi:MAG: ATP-dependent DNA ligase [Candidatus Aenigmarchaeota archaeon]|nr:ATP-dependent DNA ligase [Candidatus Aenigmarchaeota archaeon]
MKYSALVETYEKLEKESGKLKKTEILSNLLKKTPTNLLPKVVLLASGKIFPTKSEEKTGIANKMMIKTLSKTTGLSESEITGKFRDLGDLGSVAEECIKSKTQSSLAQKKLTVELVFNNLQKLSKIEGEGSQDRKVNLISELLSSSKPKEAKYIVRTSVETLRIGVAEGITRDAISKAFKVDKKMVERAWFLNPNYGKIAKIAKEEGENGLKKVSLTIGNPYIVMLGESAGNLEQAMGKYEDVIIEYKYDGVRIEIHKNKDKVLLFTRRLEDVTDQFPDLVKLAKKGIKSNKCIVEGELIGIDPKTNGSIPFQQLSRRVQRKYDIEKMTKEIPICMQLFDIVYLEGKSLLNKDYETRRKKLKETIKIIKGKFQLSQSLIPKNIKEAREFYQKASMEQEGIMVKNLKAKYQPGRRVGQWLKVKPILEPLDLAIISAEWGTGKRSSWFGSFTLGCLKNEVSDKYLACGKLGTGLSDEQFENLTKKLKDLVLEEKGREVKLKPEVVIEVGYEEIQESPKYESGYALRFPRLIRFRPDREKPNELKKIKNLFKQQFSSKK